VNEREDLKKSEGREAHSKHTQYVSKHIESNKTFPNESLSHEILEEQNPSRGEKVKRFSDVLHSNNNNNDNSIHTYNTYIHTLEELIKKERKAHTTISVSPSLWREFQRRVRIVDPFSNASEKLSNFMFKFVAHAVRDRHQPKITQFFIKAKQVNIAQKQVINKPKKRKRIDYSKLSLEKLQETYDRAKACRDVVAVQLLAFELKKRGIPIEDQAY